LNAGITALIEGRYPISYLQNIQEKQMSVSPRQQKANVGMRVRANRLAEKTVMVDNMLAFPTAGAKSFV
jgi:hypothetical protein